MDIVTAAAMRSSRSSPRKRAAASAWLPEEITKISSASPRGEYARKMAPGTPVLVHHSGKIQLGPGAQAKYQDAIRMPAQAAEPLRRLLPEASGLGNAELRKKVSRGSEGRGSVSLRTAISRRPQPECDRACA